MNLYARLSVFPFSNVHVLEKMCSIVGTNVFPRLKQYVVFPIIYVNTSVNVSLIISVYDGDAYMLCVGAGVVNGMIGVLVGAGLITHVIVFVCNNDSTHVDVWTLDFILMNVVISDLAMITESVYAYVCVNV